MRKTRYTPPYNASGRTTFPGTRKKSGVYLIREDDRLVYIGYSGTNLYRTLYRHFERWNHSGQEVITYRGRMDRKRYTVRVVLCTPRQAERLERALVIRHQPRDNENKYKQYRIDFKDRRLVDDYDEIQAAGAGIPLDAPF